MRRGMITLALSLAIGGLSAAASPAGASAPAQPGAAGGGVRADFNGDGIADLAVGVPGEDVGNIVDGGAVNVQYGSTGGLLASPGQLFTQVGSAPEAGDFFGEALASGDFNGDGFPDLAVGASGEDAGAIRDAGAVSVLYGSSVGLRTAGGQIFTQVGSAAEADDGFGFALAAGDFDGNGFADLAVGAPFETGNGTPQSGAVSVLYGSAARLSTAGGRLFTQVGSAAEPDDAFGFALATGDFDNDGFADLAAGAPFEDAGRVVDAGAVSVLYGSAARLGTARGQIFTQVGSSPENTDLFGFALATGDFNGDGRADLAAGAPNEGVFSTPSAGAVSVLYGSAAGLNTAGGQIFTQVGSAPEAGDAFGFALATGDFNGNGFADLAVGAPFETGNGTPFSGAVSVLYGSASRLSTAGGRLFTQVGSAAETDDEFGYSLATGDFNGNGTVDLAAAAPGESVFSIVAGGAVSVLNGSASGLTTAGGYLFTQNSPGVGSSAEPGDFFGAALASAVPGPTATAAGPAAATSPTATSPTAAVSGQLRPGATRTAAR